jgi:hypothetical protein
MSQIPLKTRQRYITLFWDNYIHNLNDSYRSLKIEFFDEPPRIKISAQNEGRSILCMVTYGDYGTMEYCLNWYVDGRRAIAEVRNGDMKEISDHMLHDAETYFSDSRKPSPSYNSVMANKIRG